MMTELFTLYYRESNTMIFIRICTYVRVVDTVVKIAIRIFTTNPMHLDTANH